MPGVLVVYADHEHVGLFSARTERGVRAYVYALATEIALKVLTQSGGEIELGVAGEALLGVVLGQRESVALDLEHHAWRRTAFPLKMTH